MPVDLAISLLGVVLALGVMEISSMLKRIAVALETFNQ